MQNPPNDPRKFSSLRWIQQITENHCGPAVIQMLLENIDVHVTQEQITEAAGASLGIAAYGTRVDQLAKAVDQLASNARLWYKDRASLQDLEYVLNIVKFPLGVEWQGLFDDVEDDNEDYGHYSIVVHIDEAKDELIIVDPYKDFVDQNRIIRISTFLKRWWDFNDVRDPKSGKLVSKKDEQLFFVITPKGTSFPLALGMQSYF